MPKHPTPQNLIHTLGPHQRLLGLDYGTRRIGLAMGSLEARLATPLLVYTRRKLKEDAAFLATLMAREHIGGLVVGWPCHMDGQKSPRCQAVEEFMLNLERILGPIPYCYWDERWSSKAAEGGPASHKNVDAHAATYILQGALDTLKFCV